MDLTSLRLALLAPDFDVERHASQLIQSGEDIGKYLEGLARAEEELDSRLQEQVATHYEDLISQATGVERLEQHLEMMQSHMATLVSSAERLRARVRDPHKSLKSQVTTLSRLQETCDLLRRVIRTLQLGKRLQAQLQGGPQEMTKAALSLNELTELWVPELDHIDVIEQDQRVILHAKSDVERSADGMLSRGMENQNQNQIGIAMQVFQNLSLLEAKLDRAVAAQLRKVEDRLEEAFDVRKITAASDDGDKASGGGGPGRASGLPVGQGNMAAFRATLWNNVEGVLDFLHSKCVEVLCLQQVLCKKRDAVSHSTFFELLLLPGGKDGSAADAANVLGRFWTGAVSAVTKRLSLSSAESSFLKQALEGEYPKLLRLFNDLWARLQQAGGDLRVESGAAGVGGETGRLVNPLSSPAMDPELRNALAELERAYLSRSLSRLFDPVNLMFSAGEVPTDSELHQVFKGVSSELGVAAAVDARLAATVCRNVAKTVRLTCVKCEQILVTDGEASQVVGYPTEGQKRNVSIVNCLSRFRAGIEKIVQESFAPGDDGAECISEALEDVDKQVRNGINPLLDSVEDAVEAIVLTMHKEDFGGEGAIAPARTGDDDDNGGSCSLYMKELQTFISRITADFLQDFLCRDFVSQCLHPVSARAVTRFVTHASIVRPLGSSGRLRLASDCAQLEAALEPLLLGTKWSTSQELSAAYATLRSFRALLFLKPEDMGPAVWANRADLPASVALHLLFSFAPPELKSPHESAGWSVSRYSQWLEDHPSERDRLKLIQGTLESYVAGTRARQEKSFAYPYTIMLEMLETFNR